jgi:hypothetical protein
LLYVTTSLTAPLIFGGPINPIGAGSFNTATNLITVPTIVVVAGDRIGIRIRTLAATDASAADITQLSFSASLSYVL